MRALLAIVFFAAGIAGLSEAGAADLSSGHAGRSGYAVHFTGVGVRAGQVLIYDDQPGVSIRSYWREPWRDRHYYPFTGKRPKVGRHENLSAVRPAPKPAETYYREWSTISLYPVVRSSPIASPALVPQPYSGPLK